MRFTSTLGSIGASPIFLTTLLVLLLSEVTAGQGKYECGIQALSFRPTKAVLEKLRDSDLPELAKIEIQSPTEGSIWSKTLKIPGSPGLYAYVEIFFDDDMDYYGDLASAMTISTDVTRGRVWGARTTVALSQAHAYLQEFTQTELETVFFSRSFRGVVNVICRAPKPVSKPE